MAGVTVLQVPCVVSAFPDLLSGQVQVYFSPIPAAIGYVKAGQLRALGVTSAKRQDTLPDVPAIGEFVTGYEANGWYGLVPHRNTPATIIDQLNTDTNVVTANP